jgi:carnitine 3-dehydrogenase
MKAAIIGGGVIGGGWAARFLLNGWDVSVHDPDPEAERKLGAVLANARRALPALYDKALPPEGKLAVAGSLAEAAAGADWVQESVPERLDVKHRVLGEIVAAASDTAVIASSTSGFKPSELTAQGARAIVAHPFNPVYLLPLVELVGDLSATRRAAGILRGIGMRPLPLRREIDAHIADRFLEAVWREALWLVRDGVATTGEIDDAIRLGFGLRWAQMGLFETYRIAGGEAGMRHFLAQFGPALHWPWTKLTDVPELDDALVDAIAAQSDAQAAGRSIRELERERDDNLVALIRALKRTGAAAGGVVAAHEAGLPEPDAGPGTGARRGTTSAAEPLAPNPSGRPAPAAAPLPEPGPTRAPEPEAIRAPESEATRGPEPEASGSPEPEAARAPVTEAAGLPVTVDRVIPPTWTDYNGHMNELHYMEAAAQANDRFMEMIGADAAYIASGRSWFTAETHICHLDEMREGERLRVMTQVLHGEGKAALLFHRLLNAAGETCATVESLQLHVDLATRRTSPPGEEVAALLAALAAAHLGLPAPAQAGRGIAVRR